MKCPNCGVTISKYLKYCPRCGILFKSDDVDKYSKIFNDKYMEIYFPNRELKYHLDRISIGYALFTFGYAIYKKMYKIAIISLIFQTLCFFVLPIILSMLGISVIAFFFPVLFAYAFIIGVYFYYVFNFDRLLIENRQFRVNKILRENENKSESYLIEIMEKDSKGNIAGVTIIFVIVIILIILKILFL